MSLSRTRCLSSLLTHSCLFSTTPKTVKTFQHLLRPHTGCVMSKPMIPAFYSTSTSTPELSKAQQLKRAFKDYGATVLLFHIGMSLCSLGLWYLVVSSGVDVPALLRKINIDESHLHLASGASTFVVAYAVHKMTAPIRISITLASAPFIVAYLRRIGVLKIKKTVDAKTAKSVDLKTKPQDKINTTEKS